MNSSIRTYEDLEQHKKQLEELLAAQKELIRYDMLELKEQLRPVAKMVVLSQKLLSKSADHSLLVSGAGVLTEMLSKKLLPRGSWLSRLVVPFLAKNISTHLVAANKKAIVDRIFLALES